MVILYEKEYYCKQCVDIVIQFYYSKYINNQYKDYIMSQIITIKTLFPLNSDKFDIDVNKKHQTEITIFSDMTDDSLILTVELLKENDIIQDVVITKAEYWYEDTHTSEEIFVTKYLQNLADNIIKKYDETAFTDYEPQYKSDYDMYGVLEQDFH